MDAVISSRPRDRVSDSGCASSTKSLIKRASPNVRRAERLSACSSRASARTASAAGSPDAQNHSERTTEQGPAVDSSHSQPRRDRTPAEARLIRLADETVPVLARRVWRKDWRKSSGPVRRGDELRTCWPVRGSAVVAASGPASSFGGDATSSGAGSRNARPVLVGLYRRDVMRPARERPSTTPEADARTRNLLRTARKMVLGCLTVAARSVVASGTSVGSTSPVTSATRRAPSSIPSCLAGSSTPPRVARDRSSPPCRARRQLAIGTGAIRSTARPPS